MRFEFEDLLAAGGLDVAACGLGGKLVLSILHPLDLIVASRFVDWILVSCN